MWKRYFLPVFCLFFHVDNIVNNLYFLKRVIHSFNMLKFALVFSTINSQKIHLLVWINFIHNFILPWIFLLEIRFHSNRNNKLEYLIIVKKISLQPFYSFLKLKQCFRKLFVLFYILFYFVYGMKYCCVISSAIVLAYF